MPRRWHHEHVFARVVGMATVERSRRTRAGIRRLASPRPAAVEADASGVPVAVAGRAVEHLRDEWRVDEGWWTGRPVSRRYFELVLATGADVVVFHDRRDGRWYAQRGS
jgi:hypothetical protein